MLAPLASALLGLAAAVLRAAVSALGSLFDALTALAAPFPLSAADCRGASFEGGADAASAFLGAPRNGAAGGSGGAGASGVASGGGSGEPAFCLRNSRVPVAPHLASLDDAIAEAFHRRVPLLVFVHSELSSASQTLLRSLLALPPPPIVFNSSASTTTTPPAHTAVAIGANGASSSSLPPTPTDEAAFGGAIGARCAFYAVSALSPEAWRLRATRHTPLPFVAAFAAVGRAPAPATLEPDLHLGASLGRDAAMQHASSGGMAPLATLEGAWPGALNAAAVRAFAAQCARRHAALQREQEEGEEGTAARAAAVAPAAAALGGGDRGDRW